MKNELEYLATLARVVAATNARELMDHASLAAIAKRYNK